MRALAVDRDGKLAVPEVSVPACGEGQALVKTLACGVCRGTDLKLVHGSFKNMHDYPLLLGHESVGRVVEVGSAVTKYKPGDMVLLPYLYDPQDGYFPGWGGYAEYALVGDEGAYARAGRGMETPAYNEGFYAQTVLLPTDRVDAVGATMIVTFREVLAAMRRFGFAPNESLLVYGAGPVGLCFALFAKLLGMAPVVMVANREEKAAQALRMGADAAINNKTQDVAAEVKKLMPGGADNVVDAVGANALLNEAMGLIRDNGRICGYGISSELGMPLDWSRAPYNWRLNFQQMPSKYEEYLAHSQVMAWINAGILDPMAFISDVFDFEDILDAFALAEQRRPNTGKIVIRYPE